MRQMTPEVQRVHLHYGTVELFICLFIVWMKYMFIRTRIRTAKHFDCMECRSQGHPNALPLPQALSSPMPRSELPVSIDYRESVWMGSWIFSRSELR